MKIVDRGHKYKVSNYDTSIEHTYQDLVFIKKVRITEGVEIINGTTNEEIMKVMKDRFRFQNSEKPNEKTQKIISLVDDIIKLMEERKEEVRTLYKKNNG